MSEVPERVREVMKAVEGVHVLATVDTDGKPHMRWMGAIVEDQDAEWTFYLACAKDSRKMVQLADNPNAQLIFSRPDFSAVATLAGTAEKVDTPEIRKLLWDAVPAMQQYYTGVDDPRMGIIRFKTQCLELLCLNEQHEPYCFEMA